MKATKRTKKTKRPKKVNHHPANIERGERTQPMVDDYIELMGPGHDLETAVQDLMSDMMHLLTIRGLDARLIHEQALGMFEDELRQPES